MAFYGTGLITLGIHQVEELRQETNPDEQPERYGALSEVLDALGVLRETDGGLSS